jgi:hypothetical protein
MVGPMVTWASGILVGDDREVGVVLDQEGGIDHLAVDLAGQRGLAQAGGDARRHLGHGHRAFELTAGAVRKSHIQHLDLLSAPMRPLRLINLKRKIFRRKKTRTRRVLFDVVELLETKEHRTASSDSPTTSL